MSKSHILFSTTGNGDMFFTGLVSAYDLVKPDLSSETQLILDGTHNDAPISDKLMALAELFTTLEEDK